MITLQHSLVYLSSLIKDGKINIESFKENIPWVLLPDAIRCYTRSREYSHFEESSTIDEDVSWMEFPENLKNLNMENLPPMYLANGIKKAVIGENTNLDTFHAHNSSHLHYAAIRTHLEQDIVLDNILRQIVDCSQKYEDIFTVQATGEEINGPELRKRVASFEKFGFLLFSKKVFEQTGILLNQQWFDENVKTALEQTYSQNMADNTYKYMKIDPQIEKRISSQQFDLTEEDIVEIGLGQNIQDVLDNMYEESLLKTFLVQISQNKETFEANKQYLQELQSALTSKIEILKKGFNRGE